MSAIASNGDVVDGRYRIESRLGTGGMADVFLAEDEQLQRQVALKLLHRRFAEDPGFVERFRREAQSAASMQHPNVVSVFDRGSWDGTYYIAMEYLQGRTLKQIIREEAPLDPVRAIDITVQILKATRFAHRRGVIHRDLKPHNVMVDENDHAKVTDFGIARAGASDMTETGSIMGTAQYLSPEQAQGLAVGEASDLYSVGVVLYELLTGRVPFDAESAVTIALKHVSEAPTPPSTYNPQIPPALQQAVLWSLNKNPTDRPHDAEQFINVLENIRESLLAGGAGQVTRDMAALSAGAIAAATAGDTGVQATSGPLPRVQLGSHAVADPTGVIAAAGGAGTAGSAGGASGQPPSRGRRWLPWVAGVLILLLIAGGVVAIIATRPSKKTVPLVVGLTESEAISKVESVGLNPSTINTASAYPAQQIIQQSPLGGAHIDSGSTVTLTVSTGPGPVSVPSVAGLTQQVAEAQLKKAGLRYRVVPQTSSSAPKGQVISTDPDAGSSSQTGQTIVLYVSSGTAPETVPDVTTDTLSTAQTTLTNAGFTVSSVTQKTSTQTAGTVLSQSPAGGSKRPSGTGISLVVASQGTVPSVVGQSSAAAKKALTAAGFKVAETYQTVTATSENGQVQSQDPGANDKLSPGSTVTIVVGKYSAATTTTTTSSTTTAPPATTTAAQATTTASTTATNASDITTAPPKTTTNSGFPLL